VKVDIGGALCGRSLISPAAHSVDYVIIGHTHPCGLVLAAAFRRTLRIDKVPAWAD
jgi:hypothetical protein